ncbi:sigma-54-dependent Fis family transcriptional regulator [Pseudomonas putida]|nr:sigma-54-dependent Fis family transcriptional regulator [Pseudomonas putida]
MDRSHPPFDDSERFDSWSKVHGDSSQLHSNKSPTIDELARCLFFSPADGRIWLNDQRMLLLHSSSFGALRRELIDSQGVEKTRGVLTRTGYLSGARDARLIRARWPDADAATVFLAGTRLHTLEGMTKVETVHFQFDLDVGFYEGEFLWHHSCEADEHIAAYDIGQDPVCWTELGYATGYVSGLFGRLVIFREIECRAMGHKHCRVIGKTVEQWGDVEVDLHYLNPGVASRTSFPLKEEISTAQISSNGVPVGESTIFSAACHALRRVASTSATVLLSGESGVGKELFARELHRLSLRQKDPFIAINCAAIPENLIEAELFGVERGAYTGASNSRPGRFERANRGTLFLDEIACLSLPGQAKLLRVLQEREVERVGGGQAVRVDVRVVAATNVDLRKAVQAGEFREDLFYRLNVYPIHLPPLRERRDDIPLLVSAFLHRYCEEYGRSPTGFTTRALKALLLYEFPGNVRELQNLVERGLIASDEGTPIDLRHLFSHEPLPPQLYSLDEKGNLAPELALSSPPRLLDTLRELHGNLDFEMLERRLLEEAVESTSGNLAAAARQLGLSRAQLAYRLQKYRIMGRA